MAEKPTTTNGNGKAGAAAPANPAPQPAPAPTVDPALAELEAQAKADADKAEKLKADAEAKAKAEADAKAALEAEHGDAVQAAEAAEAEARKLRAKATELGAKLNPVIPPFINAPDWSPDSSEQAQQAVDHFNQQQATAAEEEVVDMVFPKPVNLYDHLGRLWKFPGGTVAVPVSVKDHPYLAANGVKPAKSNVVKPSGQAVA